jgi:hypothetical protein
MELSRTARVSGRRRRRAADAWILRGFESGYPWRVAELTSQKERRLAARALRSVIARVEGTALAGPVPLMTASLRPHVDALSAIEQRLCDTDPVPAAGMLAVQDLLTSPEGVLYSDTGDAGSELCRIMRALRCSS